MNRLQLLILLAFFSLALSSQDLLFKNEKELIDKYPNNLFSQDFTSDSVRYLSTNLGDVLYCFYFNSDGIVYRYIKFYSVDNDAIDLCKRFDRKFKVIDPEQEKKYFDNAGLIKMWKLVPKRGKTIKIRMCYDKDENKYVFIFDEWKNIESNE